MKEVPNSLSYEFGWYVCGKQWVVPLVQSMLYLGIFVGYVTIPYFADNFGRRRAEQVSWATASVGIVMVSASFGMVTVGIGLFLCGLGVNTAMSLHYCFVNEFVVGSTRGRMITWLQFTYSLGICTIALVALLLQSWRALSICLAVPILLLNFTGRFI